MPHAAMRRMMVFGKRSPLARMISEAPVTMSHCDLESPTSPSIHGGIQAIHESGWRNLSIPKTPKTMIMALMSTPRAIAVFSILLSVPYTRSASILQAFMTFFRLLPVLALLVACSQSNPSVQEPAADGPAMGMPVPGMEDVDEMVVTEDAGGDGSGVVPAAAPRIVRMEATNWAFTPSALTLKKGEKVTLQLVGVSGMHGIGIPDLGISQKFGPGETVSVAIPTDKTGSFSFRCNVPCGAGHRDMTGTIVIED